MPELFTQVAVPKPHFEINYSTELFLMGSCFADNMGKRFRELGFPVCSNPFGVIFNPVSLAQNLKLLFTKDFFTPSDLNFYNELWFSFAHYTPFSSTRQDDCLHQINTSFQLAKESIVNTKVLIITLGTSWTYRHNETGNIVTNCHKIPASEFNREISTVENSVKHLTETINLIRKNNTKLKVIFSVSPIRHMKDGAIDNQRSKSALILSISELQQKLSDIYYFPAYEIFMDELRDYRYYANDLVHPSDFAIEYVQEKFEKVFFSNLTQLQVKRIEKALVALNHRPRHTDTLAQKKFIEGLKTEIQNLKKEFPYFKPELPPELL